MLPALHIEIDNQLGRAICPGVEDPQVILKISDLLPLPPNRHVAVLIVDKDADHERWRRRSRSG